MASAANPIEFTARIVHGSLIVATAIYYLITQVVPSAQSAPLLPLAIGLGAAALMSAAASFVLPRILNPAAAREAVPTQRSLTIWIVRWALCESVAVYGLVLHFLGGGPAYYLPFFVAAVALLVLHAPWYGAKRAG